VIRRTLALASLAVLLAGCPEEKKPEQTQPTATPTSSATIASTATAAPSGSAGASGKMAHCPNAVTAAKVEIKDVEGGVDMIVTGADDASVKEIRERSKHLGDVAKEMAKERSADPSKHDGSGRGGSVHGRCPALIRDTTLDVADVDKGSKLTIKPVEAKEVDFLRREVREREADLESPDSKEAGKGKMAHCPSAVNDATTTFKDAKDAVVLDIVAKDDAGAKEIRERAKHLVEAAKKDPTTVKHDGEGDGGGKLGRCPVEMQDTTLDAKDIPNGTEITVKPTKAADLDKLKKEAKDRVENFNRPGGASSAAPSASASAKPAK